MSIDHADHDLESVGAKIDWGLASTVGKKLSRPGPKMTDYTRMAARVELADAAVRAEAPVREVTGLADGLAVPAARVLERDEWQWEHRRVYAWSANRVKAAPRLPDGTW